MHALLLCAIITASPPQLQIQTVVNDSTISVHMTRTTRVRADRASMYVIVEGTGETIPDAIARMNQRVAGVADTLRQLRARASNDPPIPYRVTPVSSQSYGAGRAPTYAAHTLILVRIPRLEDVALLQAAVLTAGATSTTGETYESAAADSVWRVGIEALADSSRRTAEVLAAGQGRALGPLIEISASGNSSSQYSSTPQISLESRTSYSSTAPEVMVNTHATFRYRLVSR